MRTNHQIFTSTKQQNHKNLFLNTIAHSLYSDHDDGDGDDNDDGDGGDDDLDAGGDDDGDSDGDGDGDNHDDKPTHREHPGDKRGGWQHEERRYHRHRALPPGLTGLVGAEVQSQYSKG